MLAVQEQDRELLVGQAAQVQREVVLDPFGRVEDRRGVVSRRFAWLGR